MFAMYDDDGLNFRNTIDHLYNLQKVSPSNKINDNREDKENNQNFDDNFSQTKITKKATDIYKQVTNLDTSQEIFHVNQLMSIKVTTVKDDITIRECYELMQENSIQQLPIISHSSSKLKGIITIHDLVRFIFNNIEDAYFNSNKSISEISTKQIITTEPISDIRRVAQVMIDFNLNAMPVVENDDTLVGMISRNDIVKAIATIPHMQIWA